jgi:hypothetical protein
VREKRSSAIISRQQNSRRRYYPRRNSRADQHAEREYGNANYSRSPTDRLELPVIVSGHRMHSRRPGKQASMTIVAAVWGRANGSRALQLAASE